jgi:hypothetical protein
MFAVPLTRLHYALIGTRRLWMSMRYPPAPADDERVGEITAKLVTQGWAILERYLPAELCRDTAAFIDEMIATAHPSLREEYAGAEHRSFGAETLHRGIRQFFDDPFLHRIAENYLGTQIVNICAMVNKSLPAVDKRHSVDRWHRDSFGRQVKAIAYLVDVDESNGAFEYIPGSNRLSQIVDDIRAAGLSAFQWRISDEQVERMSRGRGSGGVKFLAPAGSVVFVDTSMIHRASPIVRNTRYALTNYYIERGRYRPEQCRSLGVEFRATAR